MNASEEGGEETCIYIYMTSSTPRPSYGDTAEQRVREGEREIQNEERTRKQTNKQTNERESGVRDIHIHTSMLVT